MLRAFGEKFTSAHAISLVALFVALGGVAYASVSNNSVKSKHIVNGQVKSADVKDNHLRGKDLSVVAEVDTRVNSSVAGNNGNQTVATVNITAPRDGTLILNGGLRVDNNNGDDIYSCDMLLNSALLGETSRGSVVTDDTGANDDNSCETSTGAAVEAGDHTVELRTNGVAVGNEIEDASLTAVLIPD